MATFLQVAAALLISALVPATAIQLGGVLMRDPPKEPTEPVDSGPKDGVLTEEEYRNVYEFDRDLVKEFEAEQPNIDEVNVWASDEDEPKGSTAEEEVQASPGGRDEYMRRKQDFDGLLNDDDWQEKKKEVAADAASQDEPADAAKGEQEEKKEEADPWTDAGITHEEEKEAPQADEGSAQAEEEKEKQQESVPEDSEQKKVERLVDIADEPGDRAKDGAADDTAFVPATTEEYVENLPSDEDRLAPFPSLDDDLEQEGDLEIPPAAGDEQQKQVPTDNAVADEAVDKMAPAEQGAPEEEHKEAPASTEAKPVENEEEEAPTSTGAKPVENEEAPAAGSAVAPADHSDENQKKVTGMVAQDVIIEDGVVRPTQPGCYVRTPKGCPNHPSFSSTAWKHEEYGEKYQEAKVDRKACEVTRKGHVAHWCGSEEVHMLFVSKDGSSSPTSPAAPVPVPAPSGAAAQPRPAENQSHPETAAKPTVDARHRLEASVEAPTEPGCFVRTPNGCPAHPNYGSTLWKHEEYGEKHTGAMTHRATCEINRRASVSRFCGTDEVETLFVPPPEPGCYFRLPSGCPKHPTFGSTTNWKHEEFGEMHKNARTNRQSCEGGRKEHIQHWCGTQDVLIWFIPKNPESLVVVADAGASRTNTPKEPGCWVRTPKGCPHQSDFASLEWKHDEFAEKYTFAKTNRSACEERRKEHVVKLCGIPEVEMLFVADPASAAASVEEQQPSPSNASALSGGVPPLADSASSGSSNSSSSAEAQPPAAARIAQNGSSEAASSQATGSGSLDAPTDPGCYVRTPQGCPKHPSFSTNTWQHEQAGERSFKAKEDRQACEETRKVAVAHWCGAEGVETLFVGPLEPGCYVRTPSGCPNHPSYNSASWKHEAYGEKTGGKTDRAVCETERKVHVAHWCGTEDIEMQFVPAAASLVAETSSADEVSDSDTGVESELIGGAHSRRDTVPAENVLAPFEDAGLGHAVGEEVQNELIGGAHSGRETVPAENVLAPSKEGEAWHAVGEEVQNSNAQVSDVDNGVESELIGGAHSRDTVPAENVLAPFEEAHAGHAVGEEVQNNNAQAGEEEHTSQAVAGNEEVQQGGGEEQEHDVHGDTEESRTDATKEEQGNTLHADTEENRAVGTEEVAVLVDSEENHAVSSEQSEIVGEGGEQEKKPEVSGAAEQGSELKIPAEPGCFMRTPSGCPNKPDIASNQWTHDEHAEKYTIARMNQTACEVRRKLELDTLCGTEDVETMFVETQGPLYPTEPGCYYRTPAGCPSHPRFASAGYKHEEYGEKSGGAKSDRSACEVTRRGSVVRWCGSESVEMLFVGQFEPGCYVRMPWGCPSHLGFSSIKWKHDVHGEAHSGARLDRGACEVYRGDHIKHWCGTDEVEMMFVPAESA